MSRDVIALPPLLEERLPNGVTVVVARRPGVPLVAVRLVVAAGSALDPSRGEGLAHLAVQTARRGTKGRTGREIDDLAESLGAELGAAADEDASWFGLSAPAESLAPLLDLVVDVATGPTFPAREVERIRRRESSALAHVLDEPGAVADRAMLRAAYGEHPYAHPSDGRVRHLARLGRAEAAAFHRRWFSPAATTLVVVGAVDPGKALALARRRLGAWKGGVGAPPPVPPAPAPAPRRVLVLDKPDATQVQVRIALPALARATPDYFPAVVANGVFGGGFTSRLMEAIRVNRGLSYGVRSRFAMSRAGGLFFVSSFTKTATAAELVEVALDEARRFCDGGPTDEELERTKSYLAGLYPLSLETHDQLAEKLADLKLFELPVERVTEYRARVRAVTAGECVEVARRHFPLDGRGVVVAVGPAREVAPQLERFGPVEVSPAKQVV
jgi:zinc protease